MWMHHCEVSPCRKTVATGRILPLNLPRLAANDGQVEAIRKDRFRGEDFGEERGAR